MMSYDTSDSGGSSYYGVNHRHELHSVATAELDAWREARELEALREARELDCVESKYNRDKSRTSPCSVYELGTRSP
jgi:hypothetical protein